MNGVQTRLARKSTLFVVLAMAATALAAPSALAQTEPELHNQTPRLLAVQEVHAAADIACPVVTPTPPPAPGPNVTAGGCRLHYSAPNVTWGAHLSAGGTEFIVFSCNVEFDARLDAAGEGYVSHQELTQGTQGTCTRRPCGLLNGEGRAYTVYLQETEVVGQGPRESAVILTCTEDITTPVAEHCEITVPMSQPTTHRYQLSATDASGHGTNFPRCEISGTFNQETVPAATGEGQLEQNVEIRHP